MSSSSSSSLPSFYLPLLSVTMHTYTSQPFLYSKRNNYDGTILIQFRHIEYFGGLFLLKQNKNCEKICHNCAVNDHNINLL